LCLHLFSFGRESGFGVEKLSTLHSLFQGILDNLADPTGTPDTALQWFKDQLLAHTVGGGPDQAPRVFGVPDVQIITEYVARTYALFSSLRCVYEHIMVAVCLFVHFMCAFVVYYVMGISGNTVFETSQL